jgi:hypothetical protein
MSVIKIKLNEQNSRRADELARRTGKTPETLVNEAFERFANVATHESEEERERFLAWREALLGIEGMWKDRDDLPDFQELRKSWDRDLWSR